MEFAPKSSRTCSKLSLKVEGIQKSPNWAKQILTTRPGVHVQERGEMVGDVVRRPIAPLQGGVWRTSLTAAC